MTIHHFGNEAIDVLRRHFSPGKVNFRGSFASGQVDEYSDVDLEVNVQVELTQGFFDSLEACLERQFGAFSIRYDPQERHDRMAQNIMVNLHEYPLFWRIELNIKSDQDTSQKWPSPFPDWCVATSAFWNVVWAVKRARRGECDAGHYMFNACEKLGRPGLAYSVENVEILLSELCEFHDVDRVLVSKLRNEITR
ncbi:MAG: hypothetical protein OXU79_13335 [Gemmatimonadota bacterium]|nr:hypothetical protein [Gemmatimonadota bacterium]